MLWMWTLLTGCAPGPGKPGATGCDPVAVGFDCSVWQCWWVEDDGTVTYQYQWGDGLGQHSHECVDPLGCADELESAKQQACNGAA